MPSVSGSYSFAVEVRDGTGGSAVLPLTIDIAADAARDGRTTRRPVRGGVHSDSLGYRWGATAYRWSVDTGTLPPGLALTADGARATLAGKPSATGSFNFTLAVSLATGERDALALRVSIRENPPTILTTTLPGGTWGVPYAAEISAHSGAGGPAQWRLSGGSLLPG